MKKFDEKQYMAFIKEAYSKSDVIAFNLDEQINDATRFAKGRFEFIANCLQDITIWDNNGYKYTRLILKKDYYLYNYLCQISDWDVFSETDKDAEYAVWKIEFILNDECIAYITSDYCAYMNEFGWMR